MTQKLPLLSLKFWTTLLTCAAIVALVSTWSISAQEVRITVGNTTAKQGDHLAIEVTGTITDTLLDSVRITIQYYANRLKIDSVRGGSFYVVQCVEPTVTDKITPLDGTLEVSCSTIKQTTDGKIFIIYCTVLAGLGTEATINPTECYINGFKKDGTLTAGKISIDDTPVIVKFKEGIGLPFANPSISTIRIPYSIDNPTKVSFTFFDLNGRVVEDIPAIDRTQGYYEFDYIPKVGEFANGAYFLTMSTESNVYFTSFLRMR